MVHLGLRRRLRHGLGLRLPAGRLAVRRGRGDLGAGGAAQVAGTAIRNLLTALKMALLVQLELRILTCG